MRTAMIILHFINTIIPLLLCFHCTCTSRCNKSSVLHSLLWEKVIQNIHRLINDLSSRPTYNRRRFRCFRGHEPRSFYNVKSIAPLILDDTRSSTSEVIVQFLQMPLIWIRPIKCDNFLSNTFLFAVKQLQCLFLLSKTVKLTRNLWIISLTLASQKRNVLSGFPRQTFL